jgi:hypothetical protein
VTEAAGRVPPPARSASRGRSAATLKKERAPRKASVKEGRGERSDSVDDTREGEEQEEPLFGG